MNFKNWFEWSHDLHTVRGHDNIIANLKKHGVQYIDTPNLKKPIIVYEYQGKMMVIDDFEYPEPKEAELWVNERSWKGNISEFIDEIDFNKEFWQSAHLIILYHGTTEEKWRLIQASGKIEPRCETRGISNRYVTCAVFTSASYDTTDYYYDIVLEINVPAMKKDGFTPRVSKERAVEEQELANALAHAIGLDDYEHEIEQGIDPETVIFHSEIPIKYVKRT